MPRYVVWLLLIAAVLFLAAILGVVILVAVVCGPGPVTSSPPVKAPALRQSTAP
jgi:hypothetical protein